MNVNNKLTLSVVSLANFAANGAIGTAAATVDITSAVAIPQTTAGITLTLPTPTISETGQTFTVLNTGTASVTVGGVSVAASQQMIYVWSGTAWLPLPAGGSVAAMTGSTSVAAGTAGTVPTPSAGTQNQYLTGGATYTSSIPAWVTAKAYAVGDVVYDGTTNKVYRRITTGTSLGTFALDTANWQELSASAASTAMTGSTSVAAGTAGTVPTPAAGTQNQFLNGGATYTNALPSWVTAKAYAVGDEVYDPATNLIYRRTVAGTSGATFTADAANWQLIGGGITTASNGLTLTGTNVALGGTLTANTTIAQAGFTLGLTNTTAADTGLNMTNLNGNGFVKVEPTGNINLGTVSTGRVQFLTNNTTRAEILNAGTFLIEGPGTANTSGLRFANLTSASPANATGATLGIDASGNIVIAPTNTKKVKNSGAALPIATVADAGAQNLVNTSFVDEYAETNDIQPTIGADGVVRMAFRPCYWKGYGFPQVAVPTGVRTEFVLNGTRFSKNATLQASGEVKVTLAGLYWVNARIDSASAHAWANKSNAIEVSVYVNGAVSEVVGREVFNANFNADLVPTGWGIITPGSTILQLNANDTVGIGILHQDGVSVNFDVDFMLYRISEI